MAKFAHPPFLVALLLTFLSLAHTSTLLATVDFSFEIQPVLANRCYARHGPDEKGRKTKLASIPAKAPSSHAPISSKAVVILGKPNESDSSHSIIRAGITTTCTRSVPTRSAGLRRSGAPNPGRSNGA